MGHSQCNCTVHPNINSKIPWARLLGKTDDISHLLMHNFYYSVEYTLKPAGDNPMYPKEEKNQNVLYLVLTHNDATVNANYVLTQQGRVVIRTGVRPFSV